MNLDTNKIEVSAQCCLKCQTVLTLGHMVVATYARSSISQFSNGVDIGIIGSGIRNFWVHFDCTKQILKDWKMNPDLHSCLRCRKKIQDKDMIQPVFQVLDAQARNPNDPTDVGISLNDRVYFAHCDCRNPTIDRSDNIIIQW